MQQTIKSCSVIRVLVLTLGAFMVLCGTLWAQSYSREIRPLAGAGPRAVAMADAHVAEAGDVNSFYWNPASLSFLRRNSMIVNYAGAATGGGSSFLLAAPFPAGQDQALGLGFSYEEGRSDNASGNPTSFAQYGVDLASSVNIAYSLSLGMRVSVLFAHNDQFQSVLGSTSFGLLYSPVPAISYALVYNGLSLGTSYSADSSQGLFAAEQVPRNFEIGLAFHYPSSREHRVVTVTLANQKFVGLDGLAYKGGVEVSPWRVLNLQAGYMSGPHGSEGRCGIGIQSPWIVLQYAIAPHKDRGPIHHAGVSFVL
ncbi:MAG: hypothetical protein HYZ01_07050 [Ignavibacteriales bacterium]|nr:hypothetical protein [Ignavibacteriales bacterium]